MTDTQPFRPRCVVISAIDNVGSVHTRLIGALREQFGTRFLVVGESPARWPQYAAVLGERDRFIDDRTGIVPMAGTPDEIASAARAYEERYGVCYLRDVIQMDRRFSAYFNPATYGSSRGVQARPDLVALTALVNGAFAYWEGLFESEEVDALVMRPDFITSAPAIWIAAKRRIPVTFSSAANYSSYVTWLCGPFMDEGYVAEAMNAVTEPDPAFRTAPSGTSLVPDAARRFFQDANRLSDPWVLAAALFRTTLTHVDFMVHDARRGRLWKSGRIGWWRSVCARIDAFRTARYLTAIGEPSVTKLVERPFILFLMQVEPEYSTLCLSREFAFTEAIIYQLAMCLPAGYDLIVKEHIPNIGNRPRDTYARLARIPNVRFADYRLPGTELIEKASAVATISGSIGKQSTLMGKPALIFAEHVDYTHMPNVRVVRSFHDLPDIVRWAVRERSESEIAAWRHEGARFYTALTRIAFDCPGIRLFGGAGTGDVIPSHADRILANFIAVCAWQKANGVPV
jgi:hypothetical protein